MSGLPTVGAHAAILGVAAFEGNVRQILYALDQLNNRTQQMANSQEKEFAAAAKSAEQSAATIAKAVQAEAEAVAASKEAEVLAIKAANDRILADNAKMQADMARQAIEAARTQQLSDRGNALGTPIGSPQRQQAARSAYDLAELKFASEATLANASALEKEAMASENAAISAAVHAGNLANVAAQAGVAAEQSKVLAAETTAAGAAFSASAIVAVAAIAAILIAIGAIGIVAIKMGNDYAQSMNTVQALTGESNAKMAELNQSIVQIGTTSTAGMGAAAAAAGELAKGGVDIDTAMSGALKSVVDLSTASAGELELAAAAKAVANGIAAFNLEGTQSVRVADALTAAAQSTTATYGDLAHGLSQVGSVANGLGYTIEATTIGLGLLSKSAIKGSDAGTSLRTMFQHLEKPSKTATEQMKLYNLSLYDANGAVRPFRDVIGNLEGAFGNGAVAAGKLTEAQRNYALATIFGTDGQRAALALINQGVEGYDQLAAAQQRLTASDVAQQMLIPVNAQLTILGNNLQAIATQFGGAFEPAIQKALGSLLAMVQPIAQNTALLTSFGNAVSALATGNGFDGLYTQLNNVFGSDLGNKMIELVNLFRNIGQSIDTYIMPALAGLGAAIQTAFPTASVDQFAGAMAQTAVTVNMIAAAVGGAINVVTTLVNLFGQLPDPIKAVGLAAAIGLTPLGPIVGSVIATIAFLPNVVNAALDALIALPPISQLVGAAFSFIGSIIQTQVQNFQTFVSAVGNVASAIGSTLASAVEAATPALQGLGTALIVIAAPTIVGIQLITAFAQAVGESVASIGNALGQLPEIAANTAKGFGDSFAAVGDEFKQVPDAAAGSVAETNNIIESGFGSLVSSVGDMFSGLGSAVQAGLGVAADTAQAVMAGFAQSFGAAGEVIAQQWSNLWTSVVNIFNFVAETLTAAQNAYASGLVTIFNLIATGILAIWPNLWTNVVTIFNNFVNVILSNIHAFTGGIANSFASAGNSIGNVWTSIWNGILKVASGALNQLSNMLNGFFASLKASPVGQFVEGAIGNFQQFGEAAMQTFESVGAQIDTVQAGIQAQLQTLKDGLNNVSGAFDGIKYTAPPAGDAGSRAIRDIGDAAQSTAPAVQDFGDGAKKAADKAAKAFEDAQKRLNELFQDTSRQLENLQADTLQKLLDAQKKHDEDRAIEISQAFDKEKAIYDKRDQDILEAEQEFQKTRVRKIIRLAFTEEIEQDRTARDRMFDDSEKAINRQLDRDREGRARSRDDRERAFSEQLEDEDRAQKRALSQQETAISRSNDAVQEGLRRQQQLQSEALSRMFQQQQDAQQESYSAQDAARNQQRQQSRASRQYSQDLAEAKTPEDRQRIQQRFAQQMADMQEQLQQDNEDRMIAAGRKAAERAMQLQQQLAENALKEQQQAQSKSLGYSQEDAATARRNAQEDKDVAHQRDNAKKVREFRQGEDDKERTNREGEEDNSLKRRRSHEDAERILKKAEDQKLRELEQGWEDEDHAERIRKIGEKAQLEVDKTNDALTERLAAIDRAYERELEKTEEAYEKQKRTIVQKWEDAYDEIVAKSPAIKAELDSMFGVFLGAVDETDTAVKNLIADLQAALNLQGQLDGDNSNSANATQATATAQSTETSTTPEPPDDGAALPPDPGNEPDPNPTPDPSPSDDPALSVGVQAVQMAADVANSMAMVAASIDSLNTAANLSHANVNSAPPVINNVTYQVNANYANTQSQATVSLDMQALAAMTRR